MKESKGVYVTKRDIKENLLHREYQLFSNRVITSEIEEKYGQIRSKDVAIQYNSKKDNLICTCRNLTGAKKHPEARYFSPSPKQIYTYHRSRSFTDIGVGSVKAFQKKKVKKVYLPETDDRGVGSSDLSSFVRKNKYSSYYDHKRTSSKCVGGFIEKMAEGVMSAKLSPIIHTKSGTTSPKDSIENQNNTEIGSNTIEKQFVTTTTQIETDDIKEDEHKLVTEVKPKSIIKQVSQPQKQEKPSEILTQPEKLEADKKIKEIKPEKSFSSDSLVQHVHNLENPSENKLDPMENKIEEEYQRIFLDKSKETKAGSSSERPMSDFKSASLLRRRFDAIRRTLGKKEDSNKNVVVTSKTPSQGSFPSHRDASVTSDPPSLEGRSYSNTKAYKYNPYIPTLHDQQPSYKKSYTGKKDHDSKQWSQANTIDSEYTPGVKGMFKLWGKKFNLDDDPYKKETTPNQSSYEKKDFYKKESALQQPSHFKTNEPKDPEINEISPAKPIIEDKKEGKKFFFFKKKTKDREKVKDTYKSKKGVTTGRCEVRDGLMIKIGGAKPQPPPFVLPAKRKSKSPESYEELIRNAWLMKYLTNPKESRNSVQVRWNNKTYATSSSTIFELMENVYKETGVVFKSKSEIMTDESSYYAKSSYSRPQNVNFIQNVEAWMIPTISTLNDQPVILKKSDNVKDMEVRISDQKWFIDKSRAFAHKIEVVLHSNNFVRLENPKSNTEYLRIDIPKGFFSDTTSTDDTQPNQTSDEEVYKIVEYETLKSSSDLNKNENKQKQNGNELSDLKVTISVKEDDKNCESKILETVIKRPPIHRDVVIQGSNVYIPKKCNVIGVGIITQRDVREVRKPILKIVEYTSDEESDRSVHLSQKKCEFAENYLQDYYRNWTLLGNNLFSWCVSDSHLKRSSENVSHISLNNGDVTKSCPNILEDYVTSTIVSSYCRSSSQCCNSPEAKTKTESKKGFFKSKSKKKSAKEQSDFRVIPKDSLEVFKKRKLYACSNKSKWVGDEMRPAVPCVEERKCIPDTPIECKKPCCKVPKSKPKKNTCNKHVFLPDCETMNDMFSKQLLSNMPGILSFGSNSDKCKKKDPSKRAVLAKRACEIVDPACKEHCKIDIKAPCSKKNSPPCSPPLSNSSSKSCCKSTPPRPSQPCSPPPCLPPCSPPCLSPIPKCRASPPKSAIRSPPRCPDKCLPRASPCLPPPFPPKPPPCPSPPRSPCRSPPRSPPKCAPDPPCKPVPPCFSQPFRSPVPSCPPSPCRSSSSGSCASPTPSCPPSPHPPCSPPRGKKQKPIKLKACKKSPCKDIKKKKCPKPSKKGLPGAITPCNPPPPCGGCKTSPCNKLATSSEKKFPWPMNSRGSNQSLLSPCQPKVECIKSCPISAEKMKPKKDDCIKNCENKPSCPPTPPTTLCPEPPNPSIPPQCPKDCSTRSKISGLFLKKLPSKKKTCASECKAWSQVQEEEGVIRLNSREKITIKIRQDNPSTEEIRECVGVKLQDEDGQTLCERKDYIPSKKPTGYSWCRSQCGHDVLVGDVYDTDSHINRGETVNKVNLDENNQQEESKSKSDSSVANIIEINFKLRVTQGDKTTEIDIENDNSNKKTKDTPEADRHPKVYVMKSDTHKEAVAPHDSVEDTNPKNDINIRILIKNYKPKSGKKKINQKYMSNREHDDFSKKISDKFQTVSTGYNTDLKNQNLDSSHVFSVHRATIDLTTSVEKSRSEPDGQIVTDSECMTVLENATEKSDQPTEIEYLNKNLEDTVLNEQIYEIKSIEKPEKTYKIKSVTLVSATDTDDQDASLELYNKTSDEPTTDIGYDPTDLLLKTSDEQDTDLCNKTSDEPDIEYNVIKTSDEFTIEKSTKSRYEEKKDMLKKVFENANYLKKPKNKSRIQKLKNMLKAILTSDSSEPEEMIITSNELTKDVIYPSLKPNFFKDSESLNNFYKEDSNIVSEICSHTKPRYPTEENNSVCSGRESEEWSEEDVMKQGCVCSKVAARLTGKIAGGGCCCSKKAQKNEGTNCDLRTEEDIRLLNYQSAEFMDVETQNSKYFASKVTSVCIDPNVSILKSVSNVIPNVITTDIVPVKSSLKSRSSRIRKPKQEENTIAADFQTAKIISEEDSHTKETIGAKSLHEPNIYQTEKIKSEEDKRSSDYHRKKIKPEEDKRPSDQQTKKIKLVEEVNISDNQTKKIKSIEEHTTERQSKKEKHVEDTNTPKISIQRTFSKNKSRSVKSYELKKLDRNTKLGISDDDKVVFLEQKSNVRAVTTDKRPERHEKHKKHNYHHHEIPSRVSRAADILQLYETKKAVLEIYAEKTETDYGEHLVAKLPQFVFNKESEICSKYEDLAKNSYKSVCKRNIVMMSIRR